MHIDDIKGDRDEAHPDDDAFGLIETDMYVHKSGDAERVKVARVQVVWYRPRGTNDQRVHIRNLNDEGLWSALNPAHPPTRIPSGVEGPDGHVEFIHTVGELWDIADEARDRAKTREALARAAGESTLFEDALRLHDQNVKRVARQSHFGPLSSPGGRTSGIQR